MVGQAGGGKRNLTKHPNKCVALTLGDTDRKGWHGLPPKVRPRREGKNMSDAY